MDADVVVVGCGPVGSSLAIMLGRAGVRTIVLDRSEFPRDKACGEGLLPAGVVVLQELGLSLEGFPTVRGVTYRLPAVGGVDGGFADGRTGRGTRRLALDRLLVEMASATPNVEVRLGCEATDAKVGTGRVTVETQAGPIRSRFLVGADGIRSGVARWMGWTRAAHPPHRYALVGHLAAPGHGCDRVVVTLLSGCEVYLAPTGSDEVLVALLGSKGALRFGGEPVRDAYARRVAEAHPDLAGCSRSTVRGAGPFWTRPATVAAGQVFLVGDAAGFLDPLTGEGMSAGLQGARKLATVLVAGGSEPDRAYRRWEAGQWRRRLFVTRLALRLTGSSRLARRALVGLSRRRSALDRLLEVNDGTRSPLSLSPADWAALAGL